MTEFLVNWHKSDVEVFELGGVEPNPRISTVRKGVAICKEESIDFAPCCWRRKRNRLYKGDRRQEQNMMEIHGIL